MEQRTATAFSDFFRNFPIRKLRIIQRGEFSIAYAKEKERTCDGSWLVVADQTSFHIVQQLSIG